MSAIYYTSGKLCQLLSKDIELFQNPGYIKYLGFAIRLAL